MHHPEWLWLLIGVLVIGTVAVSLAMDRRNAGQHVWAHGAALRAPVGDPMTVTRHAWRPDAGEETIRVEALLRRIAVERRPGKHRLIEEPSTVDERQGVEDTGQHLHTHYPLLTHDVAA